VPRASDTLQVGDRAPAFSLPGAAGGTFTLEGYLAQGPLLLAFHRGTW
jgi:peroxiredoxin